MVIVDQLWTYNELLLLAAISCTFDYALQVFGIIARDGIFLE